MGAPLDADSSPPAPAAPPVPAAWRTRIQHRYEALVRHGWWAVLLAFAAAVVWLGRYAPDLQVDAGTRSLLNEHDPDLAYYERTRALWGYDEYAIVCLSGRDWTSEGGAAQLREAVEQLTRVEGAGKVLSILDVPLLRQKPGPAIDLRALVTLRDPGVDVARAAEELRRHALAVGNLISEDGRSVNVLVYLDVPADLRKLDMLRATDAGPAGPAGPSTADAAERARLEAAQSVGIAELTRRRKAMVEGIRVVAAAWGERLGEPVRLSGICVVNTNLVEHMRHDLRVFGLASVAFFLLTFFLVYRRVRFVLLPVLSSLLPVVLIVGAMSLLGMKVTIITSSLPLLLFVLMLPYTVYFVEGYLERTRLDPDEPHVTSTVRAASSIFLPCLLSCITTIAGFLSLETSDTRSVRDFGVMLAAGMAIGLVVVFLVLPALSRPLRRMTTRGGAAVRPGPRGVERVLASWSLERPVLVVLVAALVLGVATWGTTRLTAQSKFTNYFREGSEVYKGLEMIDTRMGGSTPLEVHLDSTAKGYFLTRPGLAALSAVGAYFATVPETGNVRSLATLVDEISKKNANFAGMLPVFGKIPKVREVIGEFVRAEDTSSCVFVRMRETAPTLDRERILAGLRAHLASRPELAGLSVHVTGVFLLYENMLETLIRTQRESFFSLVVAIFVLVLLLFRSIVTTCLVVVTQVLPTMVTLGTMGWAGIPLDLVTVMIASISMGVGIDASIQYAWRHRREQATASDPADAIRRTHATVGRAIWIATTVIVCGFLVLVLSDFRPSIWLGMLNAVAMLVSQLSALTVLPSLLYLRERRRARRG